MAGRGRRIIWGWVSALTLFCLLCRAFPEALLGGVSLPLTQMLHRLTARVPFPVAEVLILCACAVGVWSLMASAFHAVALRRVKPLLGWVRGVVAAGLALASLLAVTWLPAVCVPADVPPEPDADALAWLCGVLVDQLNAAPLDFPEPSEALRLAPEVAGLPGCAVKAARYPEWMRGAMISGLFAPPTGEAIVDATAPRALVPFTAVHELMHLGGIADEGVANVAAWERCLDFGGPFADSARLWALRYASGLLRQRDPDAWARVQRNMKGPLARVFEASGGEIAPSEKRLTLPGLSRARGDYAALARWLAGEREC